MLWCDVLFLAPNVDPVGHAETVAVLLKRKGDASMTNRQGATAADLASDPALKATLQAAAVEAVQKQGTDGVERGAV